MQAVVIGASTGGPVALTEVLSRLPNNFEATVFVVQHMPVRFTRSMEKRLRKKIPLTIQEMADGESVEKGKIYIVPGDSHFFITSPNKEVRLISASSSPRPSIDMAMTSVAEHFGPETIGVVLTGMGQDGLVGAGVIRQVGGKVVVQDEESSTIYGMPKAVQQAGLANYSLPLNSIGIKLVQLVNG